VIPEPESIVEAEIFVLLVLHFLEPFELGIDAIAVTDPVSVPVAEGVNVTLMYTLRPGDKEYGNVSPLTT